jgi:hypothetical protein
MSVATTILFKSFVRPFYRENAGTFLFFFIVMFSSVGLLNGAGLIEYHYSLIMGMLGSYPFLLIICFFWLLYTRKCAGFVSRTLGDPAFVFLQLYNSMQASSRYSLMFLAHVLLLAPILAYGSLVIGVAAYHHEYVIALLLLVYLILLCLALTSWCVYQLRYVQRTKLFNWPSFTLVNKPLTGSSRFYAVILIRFIFSRQPWMIAGIKIFT